MEIINHRKHNEFQGEVLVHYTDGQQTWCYLHGAYQEIRDEAIQYMSAHAVTLRDMGYTEDNPQLFIPTKTSQITHLYQPRYLL